MQDNNFETMIIDKVGLETVPDIFQEDAGEIDWDNAFSEALGDIFESSRELDEDASTIRQTFERFFSEAEQAQEYVNMQNLVSQFQQQCCEHDNASITNALDESSYLEGIKEQYSPEEAKSIFGYLSDDSDEDKKDKLKKKKKKKKSIFW